MLVSDSNQLASRARTQNFIQLVLIIQHLHLSKATDIRNDIIGPVLDRGPNYTERCKPQISVLETNYW